MGFRVLSSETFGEFSRYCLVHCIDRFGNEGYMVEDAEVLDELTGLPAVIRQEPTKEEALRGL